MLFAMMLTIAVTAAGQDPKPTPQKLFESGKYQEAIDGVRARPDAPHDQVYLRALAHRKLDQNDDYFEAITGSHPKCDTGLDTKTTKDKIDDEED